MCHQPHLGLSIFAWTNVKHEKHRNFLETSANRLAFVWSVLSNNQRFCTMTTNWWRITAGAHLTNASQKPQHPAGFEPEASSLVGQRSSCSTTTPAKVEAWLHLSNRKIDLWDYEFKAYLEEHELVEWVVPLHQEDALRSRPAQILVAVVRVSADAAFGAALRVGHLLCHGELLRHELWRDLVHRVHRDGQTVRLFAVETGQVVPEQRRRLSWKIYGNRNENQRTGQVENLMQALKLLNFSTPKQSGRAPFS